MTRRREQTAVILILLLTAVLRFWTLGDVPPGLAHDEVANWLIARDILAGQHAIYFTAAYGHEPLYQYAQAATVALFGDNWLGLRYPSVAFGLLGLAVTYVLVRRLFGAPVALLTGGWLATSFWPVFYARVALRAISLPFTAALGAYFLFRAIDRRAKLKATDWLLAGIFAGLSLYTYMAARILPIILVAFLVYLFLVYSSPPPWTRILGFFLVAALVAAPLLIWLAAHPGAEFRITEVQKPLNRLLAGDPSLVWQNFVANLKFFTIAGDPWPRQNVPGRPVLADPVSAVLFYAGLLVAIWRWRDPRYGFLLIWLVGALGPSVATSVAPSSIRDVLGLVVVFVFPALALAQVGHWLKDKLQFGATTAVAVRNSQFAACILLLAPCLLLTVRDYFFVWPRNEVVRFDYQSDLTAVAHRLDELVPGTSAVVAGLSVHSMDGPGLELATRRDVRGVRLCDTRETLLVPDGGDAWLFVPQVVPFDVDLRERLLGWGAMVETGSQSSFASYHLPDDTALRHALEHLATTATRPNGVSVALPVSFDGQMAFLGYEWLGQDATPGESLTLLTYWRVEKPPSNSLRIFVHLMGESDVPVAQHDGLGSPAHGWSSGDWIVQKHVIPLPSDLLPGLYTPQLGLYNAPTGPRLSVADADRLLLPAVEIK